MTQPPDDVAASIPPTLTPPALPPLDGDSRFGGLDATVEDFWRFALSDLRVNLVRGWLAEFIVARALGVDMVRVEWDAYDVLWGDVRVEVKSSAYLQARTQARPSRPSFDRLRGRLLREDGAYELEPTFNADVYVFALHTTDSHDQYDRLNLNAWEFYVLPRSTLEKRGDRSIGLPSLRNLTTAVPLAGLRDAVAAAARVDGLSVPAV